MKKTLISTLLLFCFLLSLQSEVVPKDKINADNLYLFSGNYKEYIAPKVSYSDAPKGYLPFYMSHYGRHGSRFLLDPPQYNGPYAMLKEAEEKGVLTAFGKSVLKRLEIVKNDAEGRLGDLTAKGQKQLREITNRMVKNYPTIFNEKATITARSTTTNRVMASMTAALMEFSRLLPKMTIDFDCSGYDVTYLKTEDRFITSSKNSKERNAAYAQFNARHTRPERLMAALFSDTTFITKYQPQSTTGSSAAGTNRSTTLYKQLYEIAANMQSHDYDFNLNDVFTYDEWYDNFTMNNLYWYSVSAFSPLTDNIVPFGRASLLQDILDKANAAIKNGSTSANLRYGHDDVLFPLLCLMEINDCEWSVSDYEKVADKWVDYDIVHMGSNLQLVFYKNKKGPVLVKALLSEVEADLPVESYRDSKGKVFEHYYEWEKVNNYYQGKLDAYYAKKAEATKND